MDRIQIWVDTGGGFLKNDASPSGLDHWFRNLGNLENVVRNLCFSFDEVVVFGGSGLPNFLLILIFIRFMLTERN